MLVFCFNKLKKTNILVSEIYKTYLQNFVNFDGLKIIHHVNIKANFSSKLGIKLYNFYYVMLCKTNKNTITFIIT